MSTTFNTKPLIGLTCRFDEGNDWYYLPGEYSRAVAAAGGVPVQIPLIPAIAREFVAQVDAIVLCGSPSDIDPARYGQARRPEVKLIHPDRDEADFRILEEIFQEQKPVLGICFGMQSLNVYLGGTLIQHIPGSIAGAMEHNARETRHAVFLQPDSQFADYAGGLGEIIVNSTHHQSLQKTGRGLKVAARAPDGVIEAVEGNFPGHLVMGVQWHPERIWQDESVSRRIFSELIRAAAKRRRTRKTTQVENFDRSA